MSWNTSSVAVQLHRPILSRHNIMVSSTTTSLHRIDMTGRRVSEIGQHGIMGRLRIDEFINLFVTLKFLANYLIKINRLYINDIINLSSPVATARFWAFGSRSYWLLPFCRRQNRRLSGLLPVRLAEAQNHGQLDERWLMPGSRSPCCWLQRPSSRFGQKGFCGHFRNCQHVKMITVAARWQSVTKTMAIVYSDGGHK